MTNETKRYVEVVVSDDSTSGDCSQVSKEILEEWGGKWKYFLNSTRLGMAANWNNSIKLASGKYILVLHDDDFLYKGSVENIIDSIKKFENQYKVLLFGAYVVNDQEQVLKKQIFPQELYLLPKQALLRLMSNSSFVRFPALVIHHEVFKEVGYFNINIGGVADLDMWIRLFSKFGVMCLPITTCAYTVHSEALTSNMFTLEVVEQLISLFSQVNDLNILNTITLEKSKSNFFHQFILAGTYRQIKKRDFIQASKVIQLFDMYDIKQLKIPIKWLLLRRFFEISLFMYSRFYHFKKQD